MGILIHAKGVYCNHPHVHESYDIKQVTCKACKHVLQENKAAMSKFISDGNINVSQTKKRIREVDRKIIAESKSKYGLCQKCLSKLVLRRNKKTNTDFLGCSKYPNCKYTAVYNLNMLRK